MNVGFIEHHDEFLGGNRRVDRSVVRVRWTLGCDPPLAVITPFQRYLEVAEWLACAILGSGVVADDMRMRTISSITLRNQTMGAAESGSQVARNGGSTTHPSCSGAP